MLKEKKQDTNKLKPEILLISDIADETVGGKAQGLARLTQMGLTVPPAFVIVNASLNSFPEDLEKHYQLGLNGGLVAVRSSALGEDGAETSFAGQYETILNVQGIDALKTAIKDCIASLDNSRAQAYRDSTQKSAIENEPPQSQMCVVVQTMVQARAAGVLFSVDPVSGRHDRLVIDAVAGLGEALVSGEATPDHFELSLDNTVMHSEIIGQTPVISDSEIQALAQGARAAVEAFDDHLDLEWAIDEKAELFWLQARPITTISSDLNELDTPIPADQVITRCNVGEMMPGAVCPLTFSVQGWAIERGMQHMHVEYAGRPAISDEWTQINMFYGYLHINLSGSLESARNVSINSAETMAQSLCGGSIAQLKAPSDISPWWRRLWGSWKFFEYCLKAPTVISEFESRFKHMHIEYKQDSKSMVLELEKKYPWLCEAVEVHLRSSAGPGVMEGIVQEFVSRKQGTTDQNSASSEQQGEAARLLAGAEHVESAVMVDHLDEVVDLIATHANAKSRFQQASTADALNWLCSAESGACAIAFKDFLQHHGHRSVRELCVREKAWVDEPEKLLVTMQASLAARFVPNYTPKTLTQVDLSSLGRMLRWLLPKAHNSIRRREHTKSLLVEATHRFKRAYFYLGQLLEREGHLDDVDLVFFFTRDELKSFVFNPNQEQATHASARRVALSFQEKLEFAEISVGKPEPLELQMQMQNNESQLVGRPVSSGVVEGNARVALTAAEAANLLPGEILIAPITDIGWTPYFSLIAGLATDVGSAVSHGAVIAREYGLPAIVNLHTATKVFKTGDRVRLDADKGVLSLVDK